MAYTLEEKKARMEREIQLLRQNSGKPSREFYENMLKYGGPTPADNPYAGNSTGSSSGSSMGDSIGQLDLSEEEVTNIKIAKKESDKER
jgi:hypothetical protein